jgi:hypothetical protein
MDLECVFVRIGHVFYLTRTTNLCAWIGRDVCGTLL